MFVWLWQSATTALCVFSAATFFLSFAALFRFFPVIVRCIGSGLRGFLILSFRLYHLLLTWASPVVQEATGINISSGMLRVGATVSLSIVLGVPLLWGIGLGIAVWHIILLALHGVIVGLTWDDIEKPGGLQLGATLE